MKKIWNRKYNYIVIDNYSNASLLGRSELEKEDKDENKSHTHTSTRLLHYTLIHWLLHPDVHKRTHIHIIYDTHTYIYRLK